MLGARIFVASAFLILGASFVASTAILINEFRDAQWQSMVIAHSHLFFFFPVFGLLALAAFYLPAVVFTHLYWTHLRRGKFRYLLGLTIVAGLAYATSAWLDAKPRALYEASPSALAGDRGDPAGCAAGKAGCRRAPMLDTLMTLRDAAQQRVGLSKFARNCRPDALLEVPDEMQKERYCFPAKGKITGAQCCEAQVRFSDALSRLQADPSQRSLTGRLDTLLFLPLKVFFVLIVVAIALLLAVWRDMMDKHYLDLVPAVERGVIIGAFAMLFWPLMDYGYQQTSNALFGRWGTGPQFRLSLVIVPWALLLLFYFLRRLRKNLEIVGQLAGVAASAIAILRYEEINDWSVRLFGAGADNATVAVMVGVAILGFIQLWWPFRIPVPLQAGMEVGAAAAKPGGTPAAAKPAAAPPSASTPSVQAGTRPAPEVARAQAQAKPGAPAAAAGRPMTAAAGPAPAKVAAPAAAVAAASPAGAAGGVRPPAQTPVKPAAAPAAGQAGAAPGANTTGAPAPPKKPGSTG